jgi:hypothetical protein
LLRLLTPGCGTRRECSALQQVRQLSGVLPTRSLGALWGAQKILPPGIPSTAVSPTGQTSFPVARRRSTPGWSARIDSSSLERVHTKRKLACHLLARDNAKRSSLEMPYFSCQLRTRPSCRHPYWQGSAAFIRRCSQGGEIPRRSTALRERSGKALSPRLRLVALMREVEREWVRIYKRDNFESATCRRLLECSRALSEAFSIEQSLRARPRVGQRATRALTTARG